MSKTYSSIQKTYSGLNKAVHQIKIHKMNNLDCYLRDLPDESVDQSMLAWIG